MYLSIFNRFPVIQPLILKVRHFSTLVCTFWPPCVHPWDNRGKCYMDRKRIQCWSNALQHIPIYLQPFLRYSKLLVENCDIFIPHLCLAAPQWVTRRNFTKILISTKLELMGYRVHGEECMTIMFSRFDTIPACDGQTDGRTDVQPIAKTCFSIADARKNYPGHAPLGSFIHLSSTCLSQPV